MNTQALADELNFLLGTETRSLFRHLDEAKPYLSPATYRLWASLQKIAPVSRDHAARLSQLLDQLELPERTASFASVVANYHFVTVDSLLPILIADKEKQVAAYERALTHAGSDSRVAPALRKLLEENQAQLQELKAGLSLLTIAASN